MNRKVIKEYMSFFCFILPIFIPFAIFFIIPTILGLIYSLFDWDGISSKMNFIGAQNFFNLFLYDKNYFESMKFSFRFAFLSVVLGNTLSLLLALWVHLKIRSANLIRAAFFMPIVICGVVKGFLWRFIYNQGFAALYKFIPIDFLNVKLLATGQNAFYAILIVSLWGGIGYNMVIYLAGLISIDRVFYESADIDGAGLIIKFFRITLPLMMPAITVCLFTSISGSFAMYDLNVALTNGGPGRATLSLVLDIQQTAFFQNKLGYGASKAVILLIIIMTITFLQVRFTRKKEVEL